MQINSFSRERLCTWPQFEGEGFWNSEVTYYSDISPASQIVVH